MDARDGPQGFPGACAGSHFGDREAEARYEHRDEKHRPDRNHPGRPLAGRMVDLPPGHQDADRSHGESHRSDHGDR